MSRQHRRPSPRRERRQAFLDDLLPDGPEATEPARRGQIPREYRLDRRFVDLDDDLGSRDQPPDLLHVTGHALREGLHDVPARAVIGGRDVEPGQVETGGQRPGPGHLDLQGPGAAVRDLREDVEVLTHHRPRTFQISSRTADESPAARLEIDGHLREQDRAPAEKIGSRSTGRQLRQVGNARIAQLSENCPEGLLDVGTRPGADPARPACSVVHHTGSL